MTGNLLDKIKNLIMADAVDEKSILKIAILISLLLDDYGLAEVL